MQELHTWRTGNVGVAGVLHVAVRVVHSGGRWLIHGSPSIHERTGRLTLLGSTTLCNFIGGLFPAMFQVCSPAGCC